MAFAINPLSEHTAAEVVGLDLSRPVDAEAARRLNAAFAQHHVLVFRDQAMSQADFVRSAEIFGELQPHDDKSITVPGYPEMYYISNRHLDGRPNVIVGETFHTDHSNHECPPKATMLMSVKLPSRGGDTQYVNMHRAYEDLDPALKERLLGLRAVHAYHSRYSPRKLPMPDNQEAAQRQVIHPLVRRHPENHRLALYLATTRMESILGMPDEEALALVAELMEHATQAQYEYRHRWRPGDMVIWDNRSLMHKANADYDMAEHRFLYRLMVRGERPV